MNQTFETARCKAADTPTTMSSHWLVAAARVARVDVDDVQAVRFDGTALGLEVVLEVATRGGGRPRSVSVLARDVDAAFRADS